MKTIHALTLLFFFAAMASYVRSAHAASDMNEVVTFDLGRIVAVDIIKKRLLPSQTVVGTVKSYDFRRYGVSVTFDDDGDSVFNHIFITGPKWAVMDRAMDVATSINFLLERPALPSFELRERFLAQFPEPVTEAQVKVTLPSLTVQDSEPYTQELRGLLVSRYKYHPGAPQGDRIVSQIARINASLQNGVTVTYSAVSGNTVRDIVFVGPESQVKVALDALFLEYKKAGGSAELFKYSVLGGVTKTSARSNSCREIFGSFN